MPEPLYRWFPPYERTNGDIARQVGTDLGMTPDPEQQAMLDATFAYRTDDPAVPVCFAVATVGPRQSIGKTATKEIAALTDLFVFREPLHVWTAHLFETAQKTFEHMVMLVESNRDYRRLCRKPRTANGDEAIELLTGEKIEFHARSKGGGRGLTAPKVTLDEALFLQPAHMGALLPTMATIPGAQVRYASSSGLIVSAVLRGIRDRGRAGGDPRLGYLEFGSDRKPCGAEGCTHRAGEPGCALDDVDLRVAANYPGLMSGRITLERLADFRREMPPEEYAREFLGWWEDPPERGTLFDLDHWLTLSDPGSTVPGRPSFAVDVTPDRAWASIGVAGLRSDGLMHVAVVEHGRGTRWAAPKLKELSVHGDVCLAAGSPAASLEVDLVAVGVEPTLVSSSEYVRACGAFFDLVTESRLRHLPSGPLDTAVESAVSKPSGDAWKFDRKGLGDISPLCAVTIAAWLAGQARESVFESRGLVTL